MSLILNIIGAICCLFAGIILGGHGPVGLWAPLSFVGGMLVTL